jgi:hypothetical protein
MMGAVSLVVFSTTDESAVAMTPEEMRPGGFFSQNDVPSPSNWLRRSERWSLIVPAT